MIFQIKNCAFIKIIKKKEVASWSTHYLLIGVVNFQLKTHSKPYKGVNEFIFKQITTNNNIGKMTSRINNIRNNKLILRDYLGLINEMVYGIETLIENLDNQDEKQELDNKINKMKSYKVIIKDYMNLNLLFQFQHFLRLLNYYLQLLLLII